MPGVDVLLVSLGSSTGGWKRTDAALAGALERAGASVARAVGAPTREVRTLMLTDLVQARAARAAAVRGIAEHDPRAVLYSTTTAALLWPRPGAIHFDALAAVSRPGRHGLWQRGVERRRMEQATALLPLDGGALAEAGLERPDAIVVPVPVEPSGPADGVRDLAAITYAANPAKKGLDRVLAAWGRVRRADETLVVAGTVPGVPAPGVEWAGVLPPAEYRALLRRARVFATAPRREDYGHAQLEALSDGCALVTTEAPGAYPAARLARELDPRLVGDDLDGALRAALDEPSPGYALRAATALAPFAPARVDAIVRDRVLPRLLG